VNSAEKRQPETAAIAAAWKDGALGVALVGLGLFAGWRINFVDRPGFVISSGPLDYASVPTICAAGIVFLASLYTIGSVIRLVRLGGLDPRRWEKSVSSPSTATLRRLGTVVLLVAYVLVLRALPFFVATAFFLALMFVLFGQTAWRKVALVALLGSAGLTLLFVQLLKLPV